MKIFVFIASIIFALTLNNTGICIEIPLESTKGGETFGFVDVQKLFDSSPKVQEAKKECEIFETQKKEEISKKETEIQELKIELSDFETRLKTLKGMSNITPDTQSIQISSSQITTQFVSTPTVEGSSTAVVISTSPQLTDKIDSVTDISVKISSLTLLIAEKKEFLEKEIKKLDELKIKCTNEITELENSKTQVIMADFYKIISDVAREENISVVVDKSSILYGHSGIDLTDKVLDRLRGR